MKSILIHPSRRPANPRRESIPGFTLMELLVVIAVISLLAALIQPSLSRMKVSVRNIKCISQLRQLGQTVRLYAEDYNATLPIAEPIPTIPKSTNDVRPRICDLLGPFLGKAAGVSNNSPVFQCPADYEGFFETEGSSYWWNTDLNGKRLDNSIATYFNDFAGFNPGGVHKPVHSWKATQEFATVPMLIDFDDFHPRPPQTGRNAVYGDDHADKFALPLPVVVQNPGGNGNGGGGGGRGGS